jgi:hypothetical protein
MLSPEWECIYAELEGTKHDSSERSNPSHHWFRPLRMGRIPYHLFSKVAFISDGNTNAMHIFQCQYQEKCAWKPYMEPPFVAEGFMASIPNSLF